MPNLKPVLYAQFWISIPVFILSEANLGILGLGVAEPMPSWGSLLKELEGLGLHRRRTVEVCAVDFAGGGGDVVSAFAFTAGGGGRMKRHMK